MKYLGFVVFLSVLSFGVGMRASKQMEGYPNGYASDCPGSEKKAVITKKTLHRISLTVQGPGGALEARRKRYDYYNVRDLIKDPDFDVKKRTIIYAGGYQDHVDLPFSWGMVKAYKDKGYNALMLDSHPFTSLSYPLACRYMRPVGLHAAEMLANLTALGLNPKTLELAGLSLGAHLIGYIGKHYRRITGKTIYRLTGLDPAGPCFRNLEPEDRLDVSDADLVDMIATNIDGLGMATPIGHFNFYINGGELQPGDIDIWMACSSHCSHVKSFTFWLSAVQHPNKFVAVKCDSVQQARSGKCYDRVPMETNVMGLNTNRSNPGIFYLATDHKYPYYLGKKGMKKEYEFWKTHLNAKNEMDVVKMK